MTEPALAPRSALWGIGATWVAGAIAAIVIGIVVPAALAMTWFIIGFGLCILLSFIIQLARGTTQGFILRVATGALGALLAMGIVSSGFAVASLFII